VDTKDLSIKNVGTEKNFVGRSATGAWQLSPGHSRKLALSGMIPQFSMEEKEGEQVAGVGSHTKGRQARMVERQSEATAPWVRRHRGAEKGSVRSKEGRFVKSDHLKAHSTPKDKKDPHAPRAAVGKR